MKKYLINSVFILLSLMIGFTSCEEVDLTFDEDNAFIAFSATSGAVAEAIAGENDTISIDVYLASGKSSSAEVTVAFDTEGIANPAVEGTDFTVLSSTTLSFSEEFVQTIQIVSIDNDLRDEDRMVNLVLETTSDITLGMADSTQSTFMLTVVDDEHPLANWIGTYNVAAVSYGSPGAWDEAWTVVTAPVSGDVNLLACTGIAYGDVPVEAVVDMDAMTITIPSGALTGSGYGYGPTVVWHSDYTTFLTEEAVVGEIHADGSITIDEMAMILPDYGNYLWDAFNTTWTKGKKSLSAKNSVDKMK